MSNRSWPFAVLAVLGAVLVFFFFNSLPWMHESCRASSIDAAKPLLQGLGGCFEFWLNRYQTAVAALLAVGIGWLAYNGSRGQIEAANGQLAELRRQLPLLGAQAAAVRASELRQMIDACDELIALGAKLREHVRISGPATAKAVIALRDTIDVRAARSELIDMDRYNIEFDTRLRDAADSLDYVAHNVRQIVSCSGRISHPPVLHWYAKAAERITYSRVVYELQDLEREHRQMARTLRDLAQMDNEMREYSLFRPQAQRELTDLQGPMALMGISMFTDSYKHHQNDLRERLVLALAELSADRTHD